MPLATCILLIPFALIAACNWVYIGKGSPLVPLIGLFFLWMGSLHWAEPWYYWLLILLDPGSTATLPSLPAMLKDIWDYSPANRTAAYRSPQHTLKLYRNGCFELEYEPGKAELAACGGEGIDCGCNGNWRREAGELHLSHGGEPLACFAITCENGREYLHARRPDTPYHLYGARLQRKCGKTCKQPA